MVRLGVLGSGIITECHFFALEKLEDVKVAAIATINEPEGMEACKRFGANYYRDYKELLCHESELDGVIVALPNYMHYQCCVDAIKAGVKNILCEKPLCTRIEDSEKLVELVNESGVMLQVGYMKRFNPGFREIKRLLPELGELEKVDFQIFMSAPEPTHDKSGVEKLPDEKPDIGGAWYGDLKRSGGGAMTHNGSHHLDLLRYFLGDVESLYCKARYENEQGGEYFYSARLLMENGVDVDMKVGRVDVPNLGPDFQIFNGGWNESVEIVGTRGYIKVENPTWQGYEPMMVTYWIKGMCGPKLFYCQCNEQWINEFESFAENCKNVKLKEECSSVVDGYRVDYIINQMRESSRRNGERLELNYRY